MNHDRSIPDKTILHVEGLVVDKREPETRLVGPLDIRVGAGETLGLVGESGSGKTLTLRALAAISPPGLAARDSAGPFRPTYRSAMVFQDPMGFFNPRWRINRSLSEILRVVRRVPSGKVRSRAATLLEAVGLSREDGRLYPFEMSGGMIQRAAIAMALAVDPDVLLADEATSALDPTTRDRILHLLCHVGAEREAATVVVSHDIMSLAAVADRVIVLYAGRAVEEGDAPEVLNRPRHRYTDLLVRSLPGAHTRGTRLPEIPAEPAAQAGPTAQVTPTEGCPFARRCPGADDLCRSSNPSWSGSGEHRFRCHHPVTPRGNNGAISTHRDGNGNEDRS